jgi:membrane-bound inhibitor of C-type lysozyme
MFTCLKSIMHQRKGFRMKFITTLTAPFNALTLSACATLLLSACATTPTVNPTVQYTCDLGTQLSVVLNQKYVSIVRGGRGGTHYLEKRITGATVTLSDGTVLELPAQKVASGFKVSNGQYTLWSKGNAATWTVGRKAIEQCMQTPTL